MNPAPTHAQRLLGVLLGTAVGDALGLPAEGLSASKIASRWKGQWTYRFVAGRGMISDDTEHAAMVAQSLLAHPSDPKKFQAALAWKFRWWLACLPAGVGFATARAIFKLWLGVSPNQSGVFSAGNGPAMRSAVIGVFFAEDAEQRRQFVEASTRLTHTDPRALIGALAVAETAAWACAAHDASPFPVLRNLSDLSEWQLLIDKMETAHDACLSVPDFAATLGLAKGVTGYVFHTVPVALYAWWHHRGELKARFNTVSQARFYVEQLGGDFADYEREDVTYQQAVTSAQQSLSTLGRLQIVHRSFLPNFIFGPNDVVVAVGQDGLVANTLKYLNGQPLVGVNPEPSRYDGKLLPFQAKDLSKVVPEVIGRRRPINSVTMAKASLNNGQTLYAVNDLFIGPKSHGSARYTLHHGKRSERHSSSGVIVSTGMGATGWFSSLVAGANGLLAGTDTPRNAMHAPFPRLKWDSPSLVFTVREPFPSRATGVDLVFGEIREDLSLTIDSLMPERGVIFSDGIEADFLEFNSGTKAEIGIAERQGMLVA